MKTILLISHYSGTPGGPVDKLYDFLSKNYHVYNIKHPLLLQSDLKSSISDGEKEITFKIPAIIQYPLEGLAIIFHWDFIGTKKVDLAICFDSLSFIHFYILKNFMGIKKIIFYSCDYSKRRFTNLILNFIYQKANLFAYKNCNYFFSLSSKFIQDIDPPNRYKNRNYVISGMVDLSTISRKKNIYQNSIVYAGALDYGSIDFHPLLYALKKLKDNKINFQLDIYGRENPQSNLRKKIYKLNLSDNINFKGVAENKILVQDILPQYQIGLAPYVSKKSKSAPDHAFLGTDLTAKLVDYIAASLPVISTELNNGFKKIEDNKFGFLAETTDDWYKALKVLLTNKKIRLQYKKNALNYAKKYDISTILNPILKRVLSN